MAITIKYFDNFAHTDWYGHDLTNGPAKSQFLLSRQKLKRVITLKLKKKKKKKKKNENIKTAITLELCEIFW